MKILSNPENDCMIAVLPNGVTVEVTVVDLVGAKASTEHDVDRVMHAVKRLPSAMLSKKESCLF